MNVRAFAFFAASSLLAAGGRPLTPAEKSQADFERIALAAAPAVGEASACAQTQAALLAVASPEDLPVLEFRKGYCELAAAAITGEAAGFRAAAADFDKAAEKWAALAARRKLSPEPPPSTLRVLAQIARLEAVNGDVNLDLAGKEIGSALEAPGCPPASCRPASARHWPGWAASGWGGWR